MLLSLCSLSAFLLVALTSTSAVFGDDFENEWIRFMFRFEKRYANHHEVVYRKGIFKRNYDEMLEHNSKYALGLHSYRKGVNQFMDQSIDELRETLLLKAPSDWELIEDIFNGQENLDNPQTIVDQIDYRTLGVVTPIKNQGECGSCWAFSAVGAIESQYALASQNLTSLSEQELVDCSKNNDGCHGGWPSTAFEDLEKLGGITTADEYSYIANKQECQLTPDMPKVKVLGYKNVADNEQALKEAVALKGPISVAIDVTKHFTAYESGIFEDSSCNSTCNHAVLVVGYGIDKTTGKDYWIVKNSWGETWGEKGYVRMIRNSDKNCQIASHAVYPIVKAEESAL